MNIQFRPHHFLCALCFQGKGYSPGFIKNFSTIMQQLNNPLNEEIIIEVVDETDSICAPCPNRRKKLCTEQTKIVKLDLGHASVLNLKNGDKITWKEAKQRIKNLLRIEQFHEICSPCEWKKLGLCESIIKKFII